MPDFIEYSRLMCKGQLLRNESLHKFLVSATLHQRKTHGTSGGREILFFVHLLEQDRHVLSGSGVIYSFFPCFVIDHFSSKCRLLHLEIIKYPVPPILTDQIDEDICGGITALKHHPL